MTLDDTTAMQRAIAASRAALQAGNRPYGAVLLSPQGELLHEAANRQVTEGDCTAHAEMVLVREATARLGAAALRGGTVFASGEPCAMCAGALFWAGVRRIVYAASNPLMAGLLGGELLPVRCAEVLAGAQPPVRVEGPLLEEAAAAVLRQAARGA
ncbi:nucleoside deaminase [Azohydromonas caseinilytica]|uniref:Nucleoside deaminase n=1 Tax=Azohydromonas caseinilytica TaxID=2728836 RepID=A0A848FCY7_9BURK|nr:nucleoside deaminase [Azohydromonas caseinilytica]NML17208.1 nucleoside deaminase [Azohydromonas caseinilytica]